MGGRKANVRMYCSKCAQAYNLTNFMQRIAVVPTGTVAQPYKVTGANTHLIRCNGWYEFKSHEYKEARIFADLMTLADRVEESRTFDQTLHEVGPGGTLPGDLAAHAVDLLGEQHGYDPSEIAYGPYDVFRNIFSLQEEDFYALTEAYPLGTKDPVTNTQTAAMLRHYAKTGEIDWERGDEDDR